MAKDFTVPPVVFPSGGNPTTGGANVQPRRVPTAPFQPPRPSNSGIPFMSFDIGSAAATNPSGTIYGGPIGGSSSANFDDEETLLDELGIHPDQIWKKIRSILNPYRVNFVVHKDSDLSGPILLYVSFCLFQLLAGKIQFGVILGWIVVSSIFLYVVFNMLAGRTGNLDLHTCTSVVGYCMLPVVILSALSLFLPQGGIVRFVIAAVFVLWATRASTGLIVLLADGADEHRGLIAQRGKWQQHVEFGGAAKGVAVLKPSPVPVDLLESVLLTTIPMNIYNITSPVNSLGQTMTASVEDSAVHKTATPETGVEEDEDLFEIDLEAVDAIPPPHYWESYYTSTDNALLANCLLPISDISVAVPACSSIYMAATTKVLGGITEPMSLGEYLRLPFLGAFELLNQGMQAQPLFEFQNQ